MIKATEIRIGNYILHDNNSVEIKAIQPHGHCTTINDIEGFVVTFKDMDKRGTIWESENDNFEPIPLTEKWLLDFGFENKGENWEKMDSNLWDFLIILDYESFMYSYSKLEIQYVHQLQNLYFALTGEELTLKNG